MNRKQDIHKTIVTDEELKHLLTDEKASLNLTSLTNALKQKTLAFNIYLFTISLIVIVYLGAYATGYLVEHIAFAQTGYYGDLQISNIRFLMTLGFFALFYVWIMLEKDLYALIICYSALVFYFMISAAGRLLHVGAPIADMIILIPSTAMVFVLLLLLAREEKR
jgi:hypothetical protein